MKQKKNGSVDRILTLHPDKNKVGRSIPVSVYTLIEKTIMKVLKNKGLTHTQLLLAVHKELNSTIKKSLDWYTETMKLDLEARNIIVRNESKPVLYSLKK